MPRYRPGASRQTVSSRSGAISENAVVYSSSGGHNHDGENSSLIDVNKYSLWDFTLNTIYSTNDRTSKQNSHIEQFRNYVTNIIINDAFGAAGVTLGDNVINANNIVSGSISTDLLRTDAIKSTNYSYTSGNFSTAGTFLNLSDGSIISKNFFIDSSGNAGFAGAISGGTIDIGGIDASSFHVNSVGDMWLGSAVYSSAPFRVSRNGDIVAQGADIQGTIKADDGYIGSSSFGFNITTSGSTYATITSNDNTGSGEGRGSIDIRSYGDVFIKSTPTSGAHSNQEWKTELVGEWIKIYREDGSDKPFMELGNFDGDDDTINLNMWDTGYMKVSLQMLNSAGLLRLWDTSNGGNETIRAEGSTGYLRAGGTYSRSNTGTARTVNVDVYGNFYGLSSSSKKVKRDIEEIPYGLDSVMAMRPVRFEYKSSDPGQKELGFIAEEFLEIVPEACHFDLDDPDYIPGINYPDIISVAVKAIQDLKAEVDELREQLSSLS